MPQQSIQRRWNPRILLPYDDIGNSLMRPFNFAPSLTLGMGTVLGVIADAANAVQTIADTGTVSGGTFTISGYNPISLQPFTTAAIAYDASNATVKAALEAALGLGITVTVAGSGLPTNNTTLTFSGKAAGIPVPLMTIDNTLITGGGTLDITNTTVGRSANTAVAYDDDGTDDGRRVAVAILDRDIVTDVNGLISEGGSTVGSEYGGKEIYLPCYVKGRFRTSELVGLDAAAVADLGRLAEGTLANGILSVI